MKAYIFLQMTMALIESRYQSQSKPKKPEIQIETAVLPPNLEDFLRNLVSRNGFIIHK